MKHKPPHKVTTWTQLPCRFTSQLPVLGILGRTIGRALPQVAAFFLISCVIFLAFAQCFFMAYYATVPGYQSFQASLMSVLRFTVLDFDYDALSAVRASPPPPSPLCSMLTHTRIRSQADGHEGVIEAPA